MPYLASRSGEMLTSRNVRASDLKHVPSAPKYVSAHFVFQLLRLVGGEKSALG